MRNIRMFIVDDEWIIAESLSMMEEWSDRNISIVGTAYNGYDAIRFYKRNPSIWSSRTFECLI